MRRKLIEVALPLKEINEQSAREKAIRDAHPSALHKWWARRPLAACRAVLFASIVDDPSSRPEVFSTLAEQEAERERLFDLIRRMVAWDNLNDDHLLTEVRDEILRATNGDPPLVADPFCGGGSIPLEAQRLGLPAHASDLNPVAALITKALIETPSVFAGRPPVHPVEGALKTASGSWNGVSGLAEDVRYYGEWIRQRAIERLGHLYPKAVLPGGGETNIIAWLWARTITCPNPACRFTMPLMRSFVLSKKKGREHHLDPVIDAEARRIRFDITSGVSARVGTIGRNGAECLACGQPVEIGFIRSEAKVGRMGKQLTAIVGERTRGRIYLPADDGHERIAATATPRWGPEGEMPRNPRWFSPPGFGMTTWASLFTPRQLTAMTTLSDLVRETMDVVHKDALAAGVADDDRPLHKNGSGALAYGEAVAFYLTFLLGKMADLNCSLTRWKPDRDCVVNVFARQAVPMAWDFAEAYPFGFSAGSWGSAVGRHVEAMDSRCLPARPGGTCIQLDARKWDVDAALISTDPPYYDNIGYADLSDFFYVWLRGPLRKTFPEETSTVSAPKDAEIVATPYRHDGNPRRAQQHFQEGLLESFAAMCRRADPRYPVTVYYAYKQTEDTDDSGRVSTGWETMLESLIEAGFVVVGTWPLRTETAHRLLAQGTNALASSIVLVCRPRQEDAGVATRQDFVRRLRDELPGRIRDLQHSALAPVDLGQATIGPGMAIFSGYSKVLEPDGSRMSVRGALGAINQALEEILSEFDAEVDEPTRFLVAWYEQHGYSPGLFDDANKLALQKATAVSALAQEGLLASRGGSVRLLRRDELAPDWDPVADRRLTAWEACQYLVRRLEDAEGGVESAGALARSLGEIAEVARDLAYRLHQIATHKAWSEDALAFNALVVEWPDIVAAASKAPPAQGTLG